jgi:hypothetical protein
MINPEFFGYIDAKYKMGKIAKIKNPDKRRAAFDKAFGATYNAEAKKQKIYNIIGLCACVAIIAMMIIAVIIS